MDIQIKTSAGWQAPNGALGVLSSAPITPVANTTGAFASGVQIGQEQMAPLTGYTDKIAAALNPLAQQQTQLATAETQEQLAAIRRRQSVRNYIDQKVGGLAGSPPAASAAAADAAATLPTGGASPGATFTAPKAGALANASATVPGILAPAVAAANGGTQPDGSGTAAPSPDATQPGPTVAKAVPYRGGNVYYDDQNGRQHYDLASGTIAQDKLTHGTETSPDGSKRSVFYNELGHPVEGAGTDVKGAKAVPNKYNDKIGQDFADAAYSRQKAATAIGPLLDQYQKLLQGGASTGQIVGRNPLSSDNQQLAALESQIALNRNTLKGSTSDKDVKFLLQGGPQRTNNMDANLAIIQQIRSEAQNATARDSFIGERMSKGMPFSEASKQFDQQPAAPAENDGIPVFNSLDEVTKAGLKPGTAFKNPAGQIYYAK